MTILADPGPRGADHIKQFAGLPLSWIPHHLDLQRRRSSLRLNYGEIRFPMLQQLITDSSSDWEH